MVEEDLSIALNETRLEGAPVTVEPVIDQIQAPSEGKPSQTGSSSPTAIEWNQEHHRFLLKRIAQIWGYLNTEEQQAVQEILNRPISRQDIDQIDEIVKGVEWVRRLQK